MFLSTEEIARCTGWLLAHASPPVQYLTHRHILKTDPASPQMIDLWRAVEQSDAAQEIFSRQNEDGSWFSGGPWGPRGYRQQTGRGYTTTRPKFVTTAWILPFLGEMGFTAADERIRMSCESIIQELGFRDGHPDPSPRTANCCGLYAIPLRALASVGLAADERLQGAWAWLARCQREDGGWLNPCHLADSPVHSKTVGRWPWDRSCAWGSFYAAQALFYAGQAPAGQGLPAALGFLLSHLARQDPQHVQTWVYHGHHLLQELLMFAAAGMDLSAPPIPALLAWLREYYRPEEGVFRTQERPIPDFVRHISAIVRAFEDRYGAGYWDTISKTSSPVLRYALYHRVEDDWLTCYLTRIALYMLPETQGV